MITQLAVAGYRSLRDIVLPLGQLTLISGANGVGKSNLYRALQLLAHIAQGRVIPALAREGGLPSTLWAGPEAFSRAMKEGRVPIQGLVRKNTVSLKLGFSADDFGFAIDLGLPPPPRPKEFPRYEPSSNEAESPEPLNFFYRDPQIKTETIWLGPLYSTRSVFAERRGARVRVLDTQGTWQHPFPDLAPFDSMMTHCVDPINAPEILMLRERMNAWRFYDTLRTDQAAPARQPHIGTYTPVLSSDGHDLAAAIATIMEIGDRGTLDAVIHEAFPGAKLKIIDNDGYFTLLMFQQGLLRPMKAAELSEGTLRYLLLVAALLSPRPPALMILNEPEASLHPELFIPLANLLLLASKHTQLIVVSHAPALIDALQAEYNVNSLVLSKPLGETTLEPQPESLWHWPKR